jgi:hypothetical protein
MAHVFGTERLYNGFREEHPMKRLFIAGALFAAITTGSRPARAAGHCALSQLQALSDMSPQVAGYAMDGGRAAPGQPPAPDAGNPKGTHPGGGDPNGGYTGGGTNGGGSTHKPPEPPQPPVNPNPDKPGPDHGNRPDQPSWNPVPFIAAAQLLSRIPMNNGLEVGGAVGIAVGAIILGVASLNPAIGAGVLLAGAALYIAGLLK